MTDRIPVTIAEDLWEGEVPATISTWFYDEGDEVEEGSIIAEVMVEKSTFEVMAPSGGKLVALREVESAVSKGQTIAEIEA